MPISAVSGSYNEPAWKKDASIFPPCTISRRLEKQKNSPSITVGDLQKNSGVTKSPDLQLDTTSMLTNNLEGIPEESLFILTTNVSTWSLLACLLD